MPVRPESNEKICQQLFIIATGISNNPQNNPIKNLSKKPFVVIDGKYGYSGPSYKERKCMKHKRKSKQMNGRRYKEGNASLTVEAAFVLPIFIYAISIFLYFFQLIYIQQSIQSALYQTASYFTKNAYLYDKLYDSYSEGQEEEIVKLLKALGIEDEITGACYKKVFESYIDEKVLNLSLIVGGGKGITIQPQSHYFDEDEVDLCLYYECSIPVLFFQIEPFECVQRVKAKNWTGQTVAKLYGEKDQESDNAEEAMVYMTATGTKYHTHSDCSHLSLSIQETTYGQVAYQRNKNNGKYTKCQVCARTATLTSSSMLYITDDGDRYHTSRQCSGLRRTVREISISEVPTGVSRCKRCEKRDGEE